MLKTLPAAILAALALLDFGAAVNAAEASGAKCSTVTVPGGDALDVTAPEGWSLVTVQPDPSLPPTVRLTAPNHEANFRITFLSDKLGTFATKEKLEKAVNKTAEQYVDNSVEKKIKLQSLELTGGNCVYAEFTDSDLVGKPSRPDQYKVIGTGVMTLGKTVAAFTLLGDSFDEKSYLAAKKILKSGVALHK
jgi:hypothetical protein